MFITGISVLKALHFVVLWKVANRYARKPTFLTIRLGLTGVRLGESYCISVPREPGHWPGQKMYVLNNPKHCFPCVLSRCRRTLLTTQKCFRFVLQRSSPVLKAEKCTHCRFQRFRILIALICARNALVFLDFLWKRKVHRLSPLYSQLQRRLLVLSDPPFSF